MNTTPRLHLIATSLDKFTCFEESLDDGMVALFASLSERAAELLDKSPLTAASAWELAQYADMADAGYGNSSTVLYQRVSARLATYVAANMTNPAVRSMMGRTACLSKLVDWVLNQSADMSEAAQPVALAA